MITYLEITGFRGFKDFILRDSGRINLLLAELISYWFVRNFTIRY